MSEILVWVSEIHGELLFKRGKNVLSYFCVTLSCFYLNYPHDTMDHSHKAVNARPNTFPWILFLIDRDNYKTRCLSVLINSYQFLFCSFIFLTNKFIHKHKTRIDLAIDHRNKSYLITETRKRRIKIKKVLLFNIF